MAAGGSVSEEAGGCGAAVTALSALGQVGIESAIGERDGASEGGDGAAESMAAVGSCGGGSGETFDIESMAAVTADGFIILEGDVECDEVSAFIEDGAAEGVGAVLGA